MTDPTRDADPTAELHRLRAMVEASQDCIQVLDLDAQLLFISAGGQRAMDMADVQAGQKAFWPAFWEGEARRQVEAGLAAARAGQTFTFEGPARTFAGTLKWWDVQISPLRDQNGRVTQLLAVSRDITPRKVAEQQRQDHTASLVTQATQNERALDAFVRFTTTVASSTDLEVLASAASDIIRDVIGDATSGFYLVQGDAAFPLVFSSNTPPDLQAARRVAGVPMDAPLVLEALRNRSMVFADHGQWSQQSAGHTGAISVMAYRLLEQPYALFAIGTSRAGWTEQERAVMASVGRGLGLALDRVQKMRQLQERTAGLDAFVAFTEVAGTETDHLDLVRQAGSLLRTILERSSVAYYELEDGRWKARVWSEDIPPEVLADIQAGVPADAPHFAEAAGSQAPLFVDGWRAEDDQVPSADEYGAVAFLPIPDEETPRLFTVGIPKARAWTESERAIVRAVGRSLALALERSEFARQLTAQRDALELRSQELQAANEELEAFTYSASHDLRTPVRHVMGFAELAEKSLRRGQYEKAAEHLQVVKEGALRMTSLIDGMLVLSRSGRQTLNTQRIDLNEVVNQARLDVGVEFSGHPVRWQIGPLPVVQGDRSMLQQVMTNLLSNAVKYSGKRDFSEVKVWADEEEQDWRISVQDNGVGYDPRYSGKLFGIFQRLHTEREYKGTGVGLATVRRIVMKHGGQVFATSRPGEGATFSFTLPKPD